MHDILVHSFVVLWGFFLVLSQVEDQWQMLCLASAETG